MTKTATQYFLQALFEYFCYHDDYPEEASNDPHDVLFDDDGLTAFEKYLEIIPFTLMGLMSRYGLMESMTSMSCGKC